MTEGETEHDLRLAGRSHRATTWLAWSLCAVTLLILALSLVLILLGWSTPLPQGETPWRDQAVTLAGIVGAPIVGGLIASRLPRNPYGWLWLGFGFGLALQLLGGTYAAFALVAEPGSLVPPQTVSRLLELGGPLALTIATFLLLLFPTGRLPSRRWRPVAWVAVAAGVVVFVLNLVFVRPDEVGGAVTAAVGVAVLSVFAAVVLSALSLVARYRGASGVERQQLKWFALAAVIAACYVLLYPLGYFLGIELAFDESYLNLLDAATNLGLYAAVGIAILRYRLYDIDVLINRALVYGSLTAMLLAVYFGGVATTQALFRALTGQEQQPQLAVVASTLVIAALFNPLRRRIQSLIDRRFYRRNYDARKTLESFSARLRDETDLDALSEDLVGVVRETMQPAHVSLWRRPEVAPRAEGTN